MVVSPLLFDSDATMPTDENNPKRTADNESSRQLATSLLLDAVWRQMTTEQLLVELLNDYAQVREQFDKQEADKWLEGRYDWLRKNHEVDRIHTLQDPYQMERFVLDLRERIRARFPSDESSRPSASSESAGLQLSPPSQGPAFQSGILIDATVTPEEVLFSVWTDVRWDAEIHQLFYRRHGYAMSVDNPWLVRITNWMVEEEPLFGDATPQSEIEKANEQKHNGVADLQIRGLHHWNKWELVEDKGFLNSWTDRYLSGFPEKFTCAREFLKDTNLRTYRDLDKRLGNLHRWEEEDTARLTSVLNQFKSLPPATIAQLHSKEPFWRRESERTAYRCGRSHIEKRLYDIGYDATEIIAGGKEGVPSEPLPEVEQGLLIDKFEEACKQRKLKKTTIPREIMFEIAKDIGIPRTPKSLKGFKSRNKAYHQAYQYASLKGYKKARPRRT